MALLPPINRRQQSADRRQADRRQAGGAKLKHSPELLDQFDQQWLAGTPVMELAMMMDRTPATISRLAQRRGLPPRYVKDVIGERRRATNRRHYHRRAGEAIPLKRKRRHEWAELDRTPEMRTVRCQECARAFQADLNHSCTCPHCGTTRIV